MRTIAVFSEADRQALHVRLADEAVGVGAAPAGESYLSIEKIVAAACASGADCVHPGYGFLSENADFAEACEAAGLVFVGPPAQAIRAMGDKAAARALMRRIGVPVLPGYDGDRQDEPFLLAEAEKLGFPVLIKAAAGGGGRGMRRVDAAGRFGDELAAARREAIGAFGDDRVLIEKYVPRSRHVEAQILGDAHGNLVHLFERDCSLQRRRQKILEEAPAPGLDGLMREAICATATRAAAAVGYVGVGTVEFIVDAESDLRADRFWFLEMNTRLQVEHAVTEAVTGLDLVEWQFRVAAGESLAFRQEQISLTGHAVEARLCAEDPQEDFLPSTGPVLALRWPDLEGVRVDAGVEQGGEISPFYDSLIAKLIAHGRDREEALSKLQSALAKTVVAGPRCNLALLSELLATKDFRAGAVHAGLVESFVGSRSPGRELDPVAVAAGLGDLVAAGRGVDDGDPWSLSDAFQLGPPRRSFVGIEADGRALQAFWSLEGSNCRIEIPQLGFDGPAPADAGMSVTRDGPDRRLVWRKLRQTEVRLRRCEAMDVRARDGVEGAVTTPMPGVVTRLFVSRGGLVEKGQCVAVVEAMKMEHELRAPAAGQVAAVRVREGDRVALGELILEIAPAADG